MSLLGVALTLLVALVVYTVFKRLTTTYPYHDVPIPKRESWLLGNVAERETGNVQAGSKLIGYARQFQSDVFLLPEPVGADVLIVGDPALLNFILSDVKKFPSTEMRSEFVRFVIGDGLVSAPAKEHAKQRRIMGPAFTQAHIKQISPIFTEKAEELSNKIAQIVKKGGQSRWNTKREDSVVNVTELLDCASFDIIGKAGFGVDFECLKKGQDNVILAKGYNSLLQASIKFDLPRILLLIAAGVFNPKWIGLPLNTANRTIIEQNRQLKAFTSTVIAKKIKKIKMELKEGGIEAQDREEIEDLVDVVIRTNLELEQKEIEKYGKSNTMSPEDLQGQIQVLLFAGYETSSVTTSMCIHYLAHNQPVQDRLRKEINEHIAASNAETGDTDRSRLTFEELQSPNLALLMNCLKETLRLAPAVTVSQRSVTEDCIAPLSRPIPTRDGKGIKSQIVLKKGNYFVLLRLDREIHAEVTIFDQSGTRVGCAFKLASMNPVYWGPLPEKWNPDRWDNLPDAYKTASMPGPAGLPAFSNGPASCLGARFALLEMTALLVVLLPKHLFEPSSHKIVAKQVLVLRPTVVEQEVAALPLKVTNL